MAPSVVAAVNCDGTIDCVSGGVCTSLIRRTCVGVNWGLRRPVVM